MLATVLISVLSLTSAHAEGRARSPQFVPVRELADVAKAVTGETLKIETVGSLTQITTPNTGEVYAVLEGRAEVTEILCSDETLRRFGNGIFLCVAR